jgi:hypothetical protein
MNARIPGAPRLMNTLGLVMLAVAALLLAGTHVIEVQIYRYFCLGAAWSGLAASIVMFAVAKAVVLRHPRPAAGQEPATAATGEAATCGAR